MLKRFACFCLLVSQLCAQSLLNDYRYTILDNYTGSILYQNDTSTTVSSKVNYPGLFPAEKSNVMVGFQPQSTTGGYSTTDFNTVSTSSTNPIGPNYLYASIERKSPLGVVGAWLGNVNLSDSKYNEQSFSADRTVQAKGALWLSPAQKSDFKGVSLVVDGDYSTTQSNSSSSGSYSSGSSANSSDNKLFAMSAISTFVLNPEYDVRFGVLGSYGSQLSNWNSTETNYGYDNGYYSTITDNAREGELLLGLLDHKGRQLSVCVDAATINIDASSEGANYYGSPKHSADIAILVDGSDGTTFHYLKHLARLGLHARATAYFPAQRTSYIGFYDLLNGVHADQETFSGSLWLPAMVEINLFNSSIYTVVSVIPRVYGYQTESTSNGQKEEMRSAYLQVSYLALGLEGRIGEQVEFALTPSVQNNILATSLECRYSFK